MATTRKTAAPKAPTTKKAPDAPKTEADLKREAYSTATTRLRKEFTARFKELCTEEAEKRGIKYTFTPTPEEKAAALVAETIEKFPHLRDMLLGQQADAALTEPEPIPETAPQTVS